MAGALEPTYGTNALSQHARVLFVQLVSSGAVVFKPVSRPSGIGSAQGIKPASPRGDVPDFATVPLVDLSPRQRRGFFDGPLKPSAGHMAARSDVPALMRLS